MIPKSHAFMRWLIAAHLLCAMGIHAHPKDFDVVVYGGTSGGVTAAVQAARMGKSVALVSPTKHVGGLTTSGLGFTDLGDDEILGGLSRRFYHEVYLHYQDPASWDKQTKASFGNTGQGGPAFNSTLQIASVFEPKVAEAIFDRWITEDGVELFEARLDLTDGVVMTGQRITALKMEDGRFFRAGMFIDASYEGDVMAGAGVSFTIGREANATYGETINGIQVGRSGGNQMRNGIDPYVVKGVPSSGLLPGVNPDAGGSDGSADGKLQAYCFRMCLTNLAGNMVPVGQPEGYREEDYELVFRSVEAGQNSNFFKLSGMPNRKTDSNNSGGISTDFIGMNYGPDWDWTTLNHAERDALAKRHENWQRGLIWTLQNHPRVRAVIPNGLYTGWGLPVDEFTDNGNWPWQLYVREARRMVSDYVMTQKNCSGSLRPDDSVGMAVYTMDSHHTQRTLRSGTVKNEGDVQVSTGGPYPVSYRSIIPKVGECENLLVPWCLSASHMAFGSIRMEPVFMTLGQSAGTAAAMALDEGTSVQGLSYEMLAMKLRADGQVLGEIPQPSVPGGIVVDNADAGAVLTGAWDSSVSVAGYYGADYIADGNAGQGTKSVRFAPDIPTAGKYTVMLRWTEHSNRATNVPVKILHSGGIFETTVNQRQGGGQWNAMGSFDFEAGASGNLTIETTGADGYVIADAAMWVPETGSGPAVSVFSTVRRTQRGGAFPAELVFSRDVAEDTPLTVNYLTGGTAEPSEIPPELSGSVVIPAGQSEIAIEVSALEGLVPKGTKILTVTISPDAGYRLGSSVSAEITFHDDPFDTWRFGKFSATDLQNNSVSGDGADPDRDGESNLMEFFSGGSPMAIDAHPANMMKGSNGITYLEVRRRPEAMGLKVHAMESGNLGGWQDIPEMRVGWPRRSEGGYDYLAIPLFEGGGGFPRRFYRIRVER